MRKHGRQPIRQPGHQPAAGRADAVAGKRERHPAAGGLRRQPPQRTLLPDLFAADRPLYRHHAFRRYARLPADALLHSGQSGMRPVPGSEAPHQTCRGEGLLLRDRGHGRYSGNRNRPDQRAYAGHHRTEHSDRASARDLRRGRGDVPPNGTRRQDRPTRHASAPVRHPLQDGRHRRLFLRGTRHFDRIHPPVRPAQIL